MRISKNQISKISKMIGILLTFQLFFVIGGINRSHAAFMELVPPDDNTTIIYVYRLKSMLGLLASWNVRLDGSIETSLKNNTYTVLFTTPGRHSITIGDSEAANFFAGGLLGRASGAYDAINNSQLAKEAKKGTLPDNQPPDSSDGSVQRIYYFRSKGAEVEYVSRDQALREMARLTYQPSSSSKGRKLLFSSGSQPSQGTGFDADELLKAIHSQDSGTRRNAARNIAGLYNQNEALLDAVEEELLKGYNEGTEDKYHVDAIAWMCKALSASGDARYRESLARVADSATNKKIKKYAKKALEQLDQAPREMARTTSEPGSSSKDHETVASTDALAQNATQTQSNAVSKISMDYSKLNLNISKIYTVPQIKDSQNNLIPKDGFQLVVVELKGTAPEAMDIILQTKDFSAKIGDDIVMASAVGIKGMNDMIWGISGTTVQNLSISSQIKWFIKEAEQFSFAVCVSMKKEIKTFHLICGETIINAEILK